VPSSDLSANRDLVEERQAGCALISIKNDESGENHPCYHLDISQGIDPALMIIFTAVLDEAFENSMQLQCKSHEPPTYFPKVPNRRSYANPVTSNTNIATMQILLLFR
jgi:hypothetical protein